MCLLDVKTINLPDEVVAWKIFRLLPDNVSLQSPCLHVHWDYTTYVPSKWVTAKGDGLTEGGYRVGFHAYRDIRSAESTLKLYLADRQSTVIRCVKLRRLTAVGFEPSGLGHFCRSHASYCGLDMFIYPESESDQREGATVYEYPYSRNEVQHW